MRIPLVDETINKEPFFYHLSAYSKDQYHRSNEAICTLCIVNRNDQSVKRYSFAGCNDVEVLKGVYGVKEFLEKDIPDDLFKGCYKVDKAYQPNWYCCDSYKKITNSLTALNPGLSGILDYPEISDISESEIRMLCMPSNFQENP